MKSDAITKELSNYNKQLKYIFNFFAKMDLVIIPDLKYEPTLDYSKFSKFCIQFKLAPPLISIDQALNIFRQTAKNRLSKEKESSISKLDYNGFEEIIIRISLVLKNRLNENGIIKKGILNDNYEIEDVNADIIENLMSYMKINKEDNKNTLNKKLQVKSSKNISLLKADTDLSLPETVNMKIRSKRTNISSVGRSMNSSDKVNFMKEVNKSLINKNK